MSKALYERLGGTEGITQIADDLVENHYTNPVISPRFASVDKGTLKNAAATFFIAGTDGPEVYKGKNMIATHRGMNISADEFLAVLDDALEALVKNNVE